MKTLLLGPQTNQIRDTANRYQMDIKHHLTGDELASLERLLPALGCEMTVITDDSLLPALQSYRLHPACVITSRPLPNGYRQISPSATPDNIAAQLQLRPRKTARLVVFFSPKGGVGKTTISANVASLLSQTAPTLLIEDDSASQSLESLIQPGKNAPVRPIPQTAGRITTVGNLDCLFAETHTDPHAARRILAQTQLAYDYILLDGPTDIATAAYIYTVVEDHLPATFIFPITPDPLTQAIVPKTYQQLTQQYGIDPDNIWPVINAVNDKQDPAWLQTTNLLWRDPVAIIPYAYSARPITFRRPRLIDRLTQIGTALNAYQQIADKIKN